uniref:DNA cytosine methyltransferase n=1 Tax=Planktothrix sp. PCC 11201 TaxID=1729650 RepID=UPI001F1EA841|nr:DNA cytosine methyltransferase [Planktothrix sp. PCC 11201]
MDTKKPEYFLLENVKRILTMEQGHHFKVILNALASLNYLIEWRIISPINFGIPQNRERIFIFGTRCKSDFNPISLEDNQEGGARLGYTIFGINGVASTI